MIEFRCLGCLELRSALDVPFQRVLSQPKRVAVLAYLASARPRGFQHRDALLALFWPEMDQAHARTALRNALHFLRGELGWDTICNRGDAVALNEEEVWCDVTEFDRALESGRLDAALALYRGGLLTGFHVADVPEFERWLENERERLHWRAHDAASRLAAMQEETGDLLSSIRWLRIALELDPYHESSARSLVSLLDERGDRVGALREYDRYAQRVGADLHIEPSPDFRAFVTAIRARGADGAGPADANSDWSGVATPLGLPMGLSDPRSLVVLPFAEIGRTDGNDFFADGLTDELITDLSQIHALRVISRTSAMQFKHTQKGIRQIARELNVRYAIEGSVRRIGDELRITAKLVDCAHDTHVWSQKYAGSAGEVLQLQEKLSRAIVEALRITLTPEEQSRVGKRTFDNPHAYECYLQARQAIGAFSLEALERANQLLDAALLIVGDDPLLFATKAYITAHYLEAGLKLDDGVLERAEECVTRVFALTPDSYHGHLARGLLLHIRGDFQNAVRDLKRVLAENPSNPDSLLILGYIYALVGREEAAKPLFARLLAVDPLTPLNYCMPGFAAALEGRPERALQPYHYFYRLAPENPAAQWFYAWVLAWNSSMREASEMADRLAQGAPGAFADVGVVIKHALGGEPQHALSAVTPALASAALGSEMFSRGLANFLALAGAEDAACDWLENAVRLGFCNYGYLSRPNPFFRDLREAPRFQSILLDVKRRWQTFEI